MPHASHCTMEPSKTFEVDSVVDLQVPVDDDVSVEVEMVGKQHAPGSMAGSGVGPMHGAEAMHPGVASAWCRGCSRVMRLAPMSVTSMSLGWPGCRVL